MCGNFNQEIGDDYFTSNGNDVINDINRDNLIGNSWKDEGFERYTFVV